MNVVPLSQLDSVIDETIARMIRGLSLARARGIQVEMPSKIDFSLTVSRDDGINAVARQQTNGPSSKTATQDDPEQVVDTVRGEVVSNSRIEKDDETVKETGQQNTQGSDTQINNYGRTNETIIAYET